MHTPGVNSFRVVLNILSLLVLFFGLLLFVPAAFLLIGPDEAAIDFMLSGVITLVMGSVAFLLTRVKSRDLRARDGFLLVAITWLVLAAVASLPLYLHLPISYTHAFFEAISGLTTTGATVLTGLDDLPQSILFWRSLLQWLGGMGILILAVAILPLLGVGGMQLYKAEISGPSKDNKLTPRITETAKELWGIYVLLTLLCFVAYWIAGMSWFDALIHTGSTVSIGGYSSHDASIGYFNSAAIEWVAIVFMLLSGVNFAMHFSAFWRMTMEPYKRCPEARYFLIAVALGVLLATLVLWVHGEYPSLGESFRMAAFNVVSVATTTGYATADYSLWPFHLAWLLMLLSVFSTSSGSTGGGIKMIRLVVMVKLAARELMRIIHPRAIQPVMLGAGAVGQSVIFAVLAFMLFYGVTVMVASFLLMLTGLDDTTAISAVLACINNLGPGLGGVGPAGNFSGLNAFQLWVLSFTMLLGRLELLTVLVILVPAFWRK